MSAYPPGQIQPNPWQVRLAEDPPAIQSLAGDIKAHGLLQIPVGRLLDGQVQLAFGHSRLAAWQLARPGEPFPLEVRDLSDRQMAEYAIAENAQRQDLSAIEKATALQRYINDFKASQSEAGQLFGLTQSAVSNLLRLLDLPDEVQQRVHRGELPERIARTLVAVGRTHPAVAAQIAEKVSRAPESNADGIVAEGLRDFLEEHGRPLAGAPWDLKWGAKDGIPIAADIRARITNAPERAPACHGCEFHLKLKDERDWVDKPESWCARPACYDAKQVIALERTLQRVAKDLGIPAAAPGETVALVYDGTGYDVSKEKLAKQLVKAKPAFLRVLPVSEQLLRNGTGDYVRKEIFDSEFVMLATASPGELAAWAQKHAAGQAAHGLVKAADVAAQQAEARKDETPAQPAKRLERERRDEEEKRAERARANKGKFDSLWLVPHTAETLSHVTMASGGLLAFAEEQAHHNFDSRPHESLEAEHERLLEAIRKAQGPEQDRLRRQHLLSDVLTSQVYGMLTPTEAFAWPRVQKATENTIRQSFGLDIGKIDRGWNQPPVHRYPFNCWHCGAFAPGERITKKDQEEYGWVDAGENGVFCSAAHQAQYKPAKGKAKPDRKSARQRKRSRR